MEVQGNLWGGWGMGMGSSTTTQYNWTEGSLILAMFAAGSYALLRLAQFPVPERFHLRRPDDVEVGE